MRQRCGSSIETSRERGLAEDATVARLLRATSAPAAVDSCWRMIGLRPAHIPAHLDPILATLRHTRYQAAVVQSGHLLLVQCAFQDGRRAWMLPGGGREEDEDELTCVAREVLEECGLTVHVDHLLSDVVAEPPDGTYTRWRTYRCSILDGEPTPGGGEGPNAELIAVRWLELDPDAWSDDIIRDPMLHPQLLGLCELL